MTTSAYGVGTRTYVSSTGNDSNVTYSCDATHPCRLFATALAQTTDGGEIIALDAGGFGHVTIDRSVSIIANPGAYAGIGVGAGSVTGFQISTPGVRVLLRGLTINGLGGIAGVYMTAGSALTIENCVFSTFSGSGQAGIFINTQATVRIVNSIIRDNWYGLWLEGGATADISGSKFLGNSAEGIYVLGDVASTTTSASISGTTVTGSSYGIDVFSNTASAVAQAYIVGTTVSNSGIGINSESSAGTASVTVGDSMVAGNTVGFSQVGSSATFESKGNNTLNKNTSPNAGTITVISTY